MKKTVMWLVVAMVLGGGALWAQDGWFTPTDPRQAEIEVDHNVNSKLVTPHTKWGSPWSQGRARVLFFVNGRGTAAREVIELKQRFDIDPQMIYWGRLVDTSRDDWHGEVQGIQRIDRLLREKWDAYVFLGIKLENLTSEQQYLLLAAVAEGAGLVFSGVEDPRIMKPTNQLNELPPELAAEAEGKAFQLRAGRGLQLPAQPQIAYAPGWEVRYDHWALRLGRGILWAAGKAPQLQLAVTLPSVEIARTELPGHEIEVSWETPTSLRNLTLEFTLRRSDGWSQPLPRVVVNSPVGSSQVTLPLLQADDYYLDVIARSTRGIENFADASFKVISPRRVAQVNLTSNWGEIGQQLTGQVNLEGPGSEGEQLRVSLIDSQGRELKRTLIENPGGEADFQFSLDNWLPMLVTVRATLLQGETELASNWAFARVTNRNRGQFNFLIWDVPSGTLAPYAEESLARHNVTLQLGSGNPPPYVAANNIAWVPYTTHIANKRDEQGIMQPVCWNDEEKFQAHLDSIVAKQQQARQHGVFAYSLGDEIAVRGSCLSPHCLAAYQRYLQQEYQTITALNESWGTDFASFDKIQLSKADDNDEGESFRLGNYPRWYDRQAFQSYNFCQLCERFGRGFRTIDPQSICGFEGAGTFRDGDDLDGFVRSNTFWSPYPGIADEVLRSLAPREFPRANWMGYSKDADSLLLQYWRMVTRGSDAVWWWRWEVIGRFHGWLAPTFDPYPAVEEIIKDTEIVRQGLGDLLLQAELSDDGIGLIYSQPSAYAAKVNPAPSFGNYQSEHIAWHTSLRDLGLNFSYFTDRQLRLGEAQLERYKLIILPCTQALSAVEAAALREYVEKGGVLVADVRPGIFNGHVKPLDSGQLDEVFGVQRQKFAPARITDGQISGELAEQTLQLDLSKIRVDEGLSTTTAQSLGLAGESPLLMVNHFGQGTAVLLNLSLSSYPQLNSKTTPEAAAEVLAAVVKLAGIQPSVTLQDASGARLRNIEVTRWRNGETEIISIFRQQGQGEPIRLTLNESRQIYDLKKRQNLGQKASINLQLTPSRAMFFALTPGAAEPVAVSVNRQAAAPGELLRARVTFPGVQSPRAAYLRVLQPDGTEAQWLSQPVVADSKGATVALPVAFNDPAGEWTVTATELYSNQQATARFTVKGGQ